MATGQLLTIVLDGGQIIQRKLVSVENGMYFVCQEEEFDKAAQGKREPTRLGSLQGRPTVITSKPANEGRTGGTVLPWRLLFRQVEFRC
jgi:hypothetical protein